jgi:ubiquitin carboxyl-terminal hydrolase 25/28
MAPRYEEGLPRRVLTRPLCQHRIMLKFSQSKLRESTGPPNGETYYKVPSYCLDCRWHTDLVVDFRGGDPSCTRPCPNEDFPLHHFRYCPSTANQNTFDREGQNQQTHIFECSSPFCPATASFQVRPPRITPNFLSLLTDRQVIKARFEKAVSQDPNRYEGFKQIFPSTVLSNLRTYIFDALSTTPEKRRRFNVFNKNFATTLGEDCTPILISLGFSRITEHDEVFHSFLWWKPC